VKEISVPFSVVKTKGGKDVIEKKVHGAAVNE
jgi:hypothetical protein